MVNQSHIKGNAEQARERIEFLEDQVRSLNDQVKKLCAGELTRFDLQGKLDFQLKIQAELIRLSQKFQTMFDEHEIGTLVAEILVEKFDYQKALVCMKTTPLSGYTVTGMEGYYEDAERKSALKAVPGLMRSVLPEKMMQLQISREADTCPGLLMDERVLIPLHSAKGDVSGIIIFGNSLADAAFHRAVNEADRNLWETIGSVTTSAFESARLYNHLAREQKGLRKAHDELTLLNELLEKRVEERTSALAESKDEYQKLYQESEQTSERYRTLLDASPDPIAVYDIKDLPIYVNPEFVRVFGWQIHELFGQPAEYIPDENRDSNEEMIAKLRRGEKVINHLTRRRTKNGEILDISLSASAYYDPEGRLAGSIVHLRDITEQKQMEEELQKVRKLESVGVLAGGIAHDFNNILSGILLNAQMAVFDIDQRDEVENYLEGIKEATRKAVSLTQQLLTFAKGGAPILKKGSIKKLIKDSAEFVSHGASAKCEFDLARDLAPVKMDEGQMSQVMHNLILNAIQAMPHGGIIKISADNASVTEKKSGPHPVSLAPGNYVQIIIEDSGIGIPEENRAKIFDPYFTTKEMGSGLGLATTYSIINQHHGHISLDSKVNVGTIFHVYLPAVINDLKESETEHNETAAEYSGKGKVLIMDDDVMLRKLTGSMLNHFGYEVELSGDGENAIALYKEALEENEPFDAVIMDLTVPGGMGGETAIKKLLELDPDVKAIVFSGYATDPIIANYKRYGFKGYVTKPFRPADLANTLKKVIH